MEKKVHISGKRADGRDSMDYMYRACNGYVEAFKADGSQEEPYKLTHFDNRWNCNCLGFMYRRECKHVKNVPWARPVRKDEGPYSDAGLRARLDTDEVWRIKAIKTLLASKVRLEREDRELFLEVQALADRGEPLSDREQSLSRVKTLKYIKSLMKLLKR